MENDKKILALLLGSAWFSSSNVYGDLSVLRSHTQGEAAYETIHKQAILQRQATLNSITEILNALPTYKNKKQSEKDKFAALYTAIVLSAPEASKTLSFTNDEDTPKLEPTVSAALTKALTQVLTSPKADKIWNDSVSQTASIDNLLYKSLVKPLKFNSSLTLKPFAEKKEHVDTPPAKQVAAPATPITHLVYTGQDLSQYPSLISISITVDQLRGSKDIISTKPLNIIVTGDATGAPLNTQRLAVPNAKIDLSAVTGLGIRLDLTGLNANITAVVLPATVKLLIVPSAIKTVNGKSILKTLTLTGNGTSLPTWATDGSLTAANATLDLSEMTGLPATLNLSGLDSKITNIILPQTVTAIQNLPTTVTHLTANVPSFASIGAYNTAWNATSTFPTHITHVTVSDSTTTSISDFFLCNCNTLMSITLARLTAVTSVGNYFCYSCTGLTYANPTGLTATQTIGQSFFAECIKLPSVFLHQLFYVQTIGNGFFSNCTALTSINLTGLTNVQTIDQDFFKDCDKLVTLNMQEDTGATLSPATISAIATQLANKFTRINLNGNATSLPTWVNNTLITAADAILDLSAMTGLPTTLNLSTISSDITKLVINASIQPTGITDRLTILKLTGNATTVPTWATNGSLTATGATLNLSALTNLPPTLALTGLNSDITTVTLRTNMTTLTIPSTVTTISGVSGLTRINLTGNAATIPTWAINGTLTAVNATLDLSAMTGTTVDLTGINADITTIILSNTVTNLTIPSTVTSISGITGLTTLNLTGNLNTIPAWAINGSLTNTNATLDLSAVTGLPATLDLSAMTGFSAEITRIIVPANVTTITMSASSTVTVQLAVGHLGLTHINLEGNANTLPTWATDGSLTAANATLDLSAMTNLPARLDLTGLNTDITGLTINIGVQPTDISNRLISLKLTGSGASAPTWATDGSLTAANATLDLSEMTGLPATLNLSGLDSKITNIILPQTVTAIQNLPTTVTHLTANVPSFASIGAYNTAWNATSTFPTHITHVTVSDSTTTSIGDNFLRNNTNLTSINLGKLTAVTSIGTGFFDGCTALTSADLSALIAITSIGSGFFYNTPIFVTLTAKANTGANGTLSPATVTAITTSTANKLTRINLTGNATSLPAWVNNNSMTKDTGATLDLSTMTGLLSPLNLTGLNSEITTVILPANVTEITTDGSSTVTIQLASGHTGLTRITLTGNANTVPTWATNGALTKDAGAILDLSAMTGLPAVLDLSTISADVTNLILPETVTTIQNLPTTVTHLTANVSAFASIGAYNTAPDATSTFPTHITHVTVVDSITTSIGDNFLNRCIHLVSINLHQLTNVTSIGKEFISTYDSTLQNIDLSGLTHVTTIGDCFLQECSGLTRVNLSALTNAQTIGDGFFYRCNGLASVDLSGLTAVQTIGQYFFYGCSGLSSVDLSALTKVTSIGDGFFLRCIGLTSVDLSALTNVQTIGIWFFYECTGLTSVNLSGLTAVQTIDQYFFYGCSGLTSVDLSALTSVTSIGGWFFQKCIGLTSVNLTGLTAVQTIGNGFFYGCTGLTSINLSALTSVKRIGQYFFLRCTGLTSVNLSGLTAVTSISTDFFYGCTGLTSVDLSALANVQTIGNWFFYGCTGLISVDLSALTNVQTIGDGFFRGCTGLTSINLSTLTNVTTIGSMFFDGSTGLISVDLSALTNVQTIGNWFFYNTPIFVILTAKANTGANGTLSPATVTAITTSNANKLTRINLTGNATSLPAWVNNNSMTKDTGATLDLSTMTGLLSPLNFATITNAEIKTLILPSGVTQSNTGGWTNSSGTTWTR
ncbi:leucine-rich repeat domain-containing protein [Candidatus Bodocaedibacter vickermanii]|uniref:Leucine-rich repeat domain-containing protein n=1 Tax=Candidatus Bodocaedibacter vickermanii TaxID=2741701 RepID=A0A7L9RUK4_9PROT|nr:leucine-rich repeat domain-containing protein [Candidatus Paracaedibacteraceae bacterium 'Lake Konstanz']